MSPRRPAAFVALLDGASAALAAGDRRTMAVGLREAWRDSRCPTLADLYALLVTPEDGKAIDHDHGHDHGHNHGEPADHEDEERDDEVRARVFRATAARGRASDDPLILARLLADPWNPELIEIERLRLLQRWTPDPLLAAALARWLELPPRPSTAGGAGAAELHVDTIRVLAAQQDPRQLPTLHALAREPGLGGEARRQLRGAIASVERVQVRPLDLRARAAIVTLEQRASERRARDRRGAALRAAIHADPQADAPRLVYADWLSERGDPRGEFITLQVSRAQDRPNSQNPPPRGLGPAPGWPDQDQSPRGLDPAQAQARARERILERRHASRWIGSLDAVINRDARVFERGFLAGASIEAGQLRGPIVTDPIWTTVRVLDGHVPDLLVLGGQLEHLETLYGFLDLERFVALRAAGRLQRVVDYECSIADPTLAFDAPLGLRSLLVRRGLDDRLRALVAAPACLGLDAFAVYYAAGPGTDRARGDHRERPRLRSRYGLLAAALPVEIQRLRMLDDRTIRASQPRGCELVFTRDGAQRLSCARVDVHPLELHPLERDSTDPRRAALTALEHVLAELATLPLTALHLGCVPPGVDRGPLAAAIDAFALTPTRPTSSPRSG